jgi:hypothetical protein
MHDCDITLKSLLTESVDFILRRMGQNDSVARWLNVELPKVQNQRVDLLAELASGRLLHVELQSTNDPKMPLRMLDYGVGILRTRGVFPLQLVIYVGNGPLRMANRLQTEGLTYEYSLIDIRNIDGEALLESPLISDNLMAVLTNLDDSVSAIRRIMMRIATVVSSK